MSDFFKLTQDLSQAVDQLNAVLQGDENTTVLIGGEEKPSVQKQAIDAVNAKMQIVLNAVADIDAIKYQTISSGLTASPNGGFFSVVSASESRYLDLYQNENGVAVFKKSYPSNQAITEVAKEVLDISEGFSGEARYLGVEDIKPLLTDKNFKVLLGFDSVNDKLIGAGILDESDVLGLVSNPINEAVKLETIKNSENLSSEATYKGTGVTPLVTDKNLKVILGYETKTESVLGSGLITDETMTSFGSALFKGSDIVPMVTDSIGRLILGYDVAEDKLIGVGFSGQSIEKVIYKQKVPLKEKIISKAINHVIAYGQSLSVGAAGKPVISLNQPYNNLTFNGGPRAFNGTEYDFLPLKPLAEDENPAPDGSSTRGETVCSGFANLASTLLAEAGLNPLEHVILASAAGHGGYRVSQLEKGTAWYNNTFLQHVTQGYTANPEHVVPAVLWLQGENDASYTTTYSEYKQALTQLSEDIDADVKAINSQTSPAYLLEYQTAYWTLQRPDISLAQLDLAKENNNIFMVCPIYHMPHASDRIHLTSEGYKWLSGYFAKAYKSLLDGYEPEFLKPVSATLKDTLLAVTFDVPCLPLVLDTENLALTQDCGFAVEDADGLINLKSINVSGLSVVIELSRAVVGNAEVRYALDYQSNLTDMNEVGTGNLRDSDPETISVLGVEKPLFNVSPHFKLNIVRLGE
ncbi:sialate O-acetylesterase [Pseudoalteromonas neustonica]|uniref:Sialate O-acetylesterase n=1 Tax=Pseudoalteromonas neustonica TaxID=1840331 RepID=A0ABY3FEA8_9GAMM|nr:sialate O-acetylesterase [Pseudoalteromonas neustonica]TVU83797.1 sialate O-acetylesterase [Pseudoalteromonas neustonica]